jgi:GLPGLI family protein
MNSDKAKKLSKTHIEYFKNINSKNKFFSDFLRINVHCDNDNCRLYYDDLLLKDGFSDGDLKNAMLNISVFTEINQFKNMSYGKSKTLKNVLVKAEYQNYLDWEISKEKKEILGYTCYKAIPVLKKNVRKPDGTFIPNEVWFTPDLNIKASPGMFSGLPGAILEYQTDISTIKAIQLKETKKHLVLFEIDDYKTYTYERYNLEIKKYYENFRNNLN